MVFKGIESAGRIFFSPEHINLNIVGFEKFIHYQNRERIVLQLEDSEYCTIEPMSCSSGHSSNGSSVCNFVTCDVRQAIVGFRPWDDCDRIKEFNFRLSDTNRLFEAPDLKQSILEAEFEEPPDAKIVEASASDKSVTITFGYLLTWQDGRFGISDISGRVQFRDAVRIEDLSDFVALITTFLTMASGVAVRIGNFSIVPDKNDEQTLVNGGTFPAAFKLIWPSGTLAQIDSSSQIRPSSVLRCFDEAERKSTCDCLVFFIDHWKTWRPALLGLCLARQAGNSFDRNRILNACKWLESIPGAEQLDLEIEHSLDEIARAAEEKASELGLDLGERIKGAIKRLGTESRNEFLSRLIDQAVTEDNTTLKQRFLRDLHKAFRIRGNFAHRKFDHAGQEDFEDYVRCTFAVEALAFLLLFRSLPLPDDHHWGHGPNSFTEYLISLRQA